MPFVGGKIVSIADRAGVALNITYAANGASASGTGFVVNLVAAQSAAVVFQFDATTGWLGTDYYTYKFVMTSDAGAGKITFTMAGADTCVTREMGPTIGSSIGTVATITAGGSAASQIGGYKLGDTAEFYQAADGAGGASSAYAEVRTYNVGAWF